MKRLDMLCGLMLMVSGFPASSAIDYSEGVFILNEDWYGHQNSTLNYLLPDDKAGEYFHYRVFQQENPGAELGCTSQFGTIFNGKLYIVSKQAKDPGASVAGGRLTIADANTLKLERQLETIAPDGVQADGRGFIGVDEKKGYISTSNGIWILDLDTQEVQGQIEGSANPNQEPGASTNPGGSLYHGQCGSMTMAGGYVFAAHQSAGILVIDPAADRVERTISIARSLMDADVWQPSPEDLEDIAYGDVTLEDCAPGIGSVITDRNGIVWASLAGDINGTGSTFQCLLRIDPSTLAVEAVRIPEEYGAPTTSWYAWTPDTFCASTKTDTLYWVGGSRWFGRTSVFSFDTASSTFRNIIDLEADGEGWSIYGCSMRVHPVTDEIYASLYKGNQNQTYITRRYTSTGERLQDYAMIENYWFPSLPIFPEKGASEVSSTDREDSVLSYKYGKIYTGDEPARVYSTDGKLVLSLPAHSCGMKPALTGGIYVVTDGITTIKVRANSM